MRCVRTHVVSDGDSLPSIAYAAYGDATQWRAIAEANGIDDPLSLRRGLEPGDPEARGMNPGVEVKLNGQPLKSEDLHQVRVEDSLMLPDAFSIEYQPNWER